MENFIIKFKNDLKQHQIEHKKLLKQCEKEIAILEKIKEEGETPIFERIVKGIPSINKELAAEELKLTNLIFSLPETKLIIESKIEGQNIKKEVFLAMYEIFTDFTKHIKEEIFETQKIINAFENDKIKDPINNIEILLGHLEYTSLTIEEANRIIGMTIDFNTRYAKKNKKHQIKDIHIIDTLSVYYNTDGTFKYNDDVFMYNYLMELLFQKNEIINILFNSEPKFTISKLTELLEENNDKLENSTTFIKPQNTTQKQNSNISKETITALQEIRKYYKNGNIIAIPKDLEEFNKNLQKAKLDDKEIKYIMSLIETKIANIKRTTILRYLNQSEINIYKKATYLLSSFTHSNSDTCILKQYLEELQTILDMIEATDNNDDKEYLLNDIPDIIEQLSIICNKYNKKKEESSNRLIFLLNKEGIPYIYEDINSLDTSYNKIICSLLSKINKQNETYFKKILNNEELPYNMYEVTTPRAHVAFVEVDSGIYLIMGANVSRTGYKELINRLKANQQMIKLIENNVKNPDTRNHILTSNEQYLFVKEDTNTSTNKLSLKIQK